MRSDWLCVCKRCRRVCTFGGDRRADGRGVRAGERRGRVCISASAAGSCAAAAASGGRVGAGRRGEGGGRGGGRVRAAVAYGERAAFDQRALHLLLNYRYTKQWQCACERVATPKRRVHWTAAEFEKGFSTSALSLHSLCVRRFQCFSPQNTSILHKPNQSYLCAVDKHLNFTCANSILL